MQLTKTKQNRASYFGGTVKRWKPSYRDGQSRRLLLELHASDVQASKSRDNCPKGKNSRSCVMPNDLGIWNAKSEESRGQSAETSNRTEIVFSSSSSFMIEKSMLITDMPLKKGRNDQVVIFITEITEPNVCKCNRISKRKYVQILFF